MEDFLTTRQVQSILKVDRITIYRMLQDGRLRGAKIGQQWRFQRAEVERLLNGAEELTEEPETRPAEAAPFPTHCVETILNLFAGVGNVCALMLDREGNPVTEPSNACAFCSALRSSASAGQACRESWRELARLSPVAGQTYTMTCHAGLDYVVAPIFDHQQPVGWLVVGQFLLRGGDESEQVEQAVRLASEHQLPAMVLQSGLRAVPVVASDQLQQCERWALLAANAIESILKERAGFILRLQQIANLTQL